MNLNSDRTLLDNKKINGITTTVFSSYKARGYYHLQAFNLGFIKGGFKSEDTGEFFHCRHKYSKSLSWAKILNKFFTVLGGKFKFSAQDSDLEYLCRQCKNYPVSSDLKPPLIKHFFSELIRNLSDVPKSDIFVYFAKITAATCSINQIIPVPIAMGRLT